MAIPRPGFVPGFHEKPVKRGELKELYTYFNLVSY